MGNYEFIDLSVSDHVAMVNLNRPKVMNALNWQMYSELEDCFSEYPERP